MRYIILSLIALCCLASCEEEPVSIPDVGGSGPIDTMQDVIFKSVLIEDLTGVRCPNCPNGSAAINDIVNLFGKDRVIPVGIHGAFLTAPINGSKYDLRTDASLAIEGFYRDNDRFRAKPASAINRKTFQNSLFFADDNIDNWAPNVESELQLEALLSIDLELDYDPDTRDLDIACDIHGLADVTTALNITVWLTQNGIIDKQESNQEVILDYEHSHVLVESITEPFGDPLAVGIADGETLTRTFSRTLPEEAAPFYKSEDMDVIVFVSRGTSADEEVLFATSQPIIE